LSSLPQASSRHPFFLGNSIKLILGNPGRGEAGEGRGELGHARLSRGSRSLSRGPVELGPWGSFSMLLAFFMFIAVLMTSFGASVAEVSLEQSLRWVPASHHTVHKPRDSATEQRGSLLENTGYITMRRGLKKLSLHTWRRRQQ
jgi:hypothetical protein